MTCAKNLRAFVFNQILTTAAQVADVARHDQEFMRAAELYTGRADFEVGNLVGELIAAESVPCLPVLRYKHSGLDKRAAWGAHMGAAAAGRRGGCSV